MNERRRRGDNKWSDRKEGDKEGKVTFIGGRGKTVITHHLFHFFLVFLIPYYLLFSIQPHCHGSMVRIYFSPYFQPLYSFPSSYPLTMTVSPLPPINVISPSLSSSFAILSFFFSQVLWGRRE